jgi:hypothetical protein
MKSIQKLPHPLGAVLLVVLFNACLSKHHVQTELPTEPRYAVNPTRMLLVNTYNVSTQKYRENKDLLFKDLLNYTLLNAAEQIKQRINVACDTINGYTNPLQNPDSVITTLIQKIRLLRCYCYF